MSVSFSFSLFLPVAAGQRVKVEPEVLSYPGQTVNLPCAFTDATGIHLEMVKFTQRLGLFFFFCFLLYTPPVISNEFMAWTSNKKVCVILKVKPIVLT